MTHSYGVRSGTRRKFARAYKQKGVVKIQKFLTTYKRGDFVDIIVDGSQHKGMPYQLYHGRTAKVFNVNPRSIGIELQKQVNTRYVRKRFHVRVEHIRRSNCRDAFVARVKANDVKKSEAKKQGKKVSTKRLPKQPREAEYFVPTVSEFQHPRQYVEIV